MMQQIKECPLCEESLYSGIGHGCKLCGMPLEYDDEEFCSVTCETKYNLIK